MIGPSLTGRLWTVIIVRSLTSKGGLWRPITGWPSTGAEGKKYERISKRPPEGRDEGTTAMTTRRKTKPTSAQTYERQRGDVSTWARKPTPARVVAKGSTIFSLRMSPAELEEIRRSASTRGVTVSDFIRTASLGVVRQQSTGVVVINQSVGTDCRTVTSTAAVVTLPQSGALSTMLQTEASTH